MLTEGGVDQARWTAVLVDVGHSGYRAESRGPAWQDHPAWFQPIRSVPVQPLTGRCPEGRSWSAIREQRYFRCCSFNRAARRLRRLTSRPPAGFARRARPFRRDDDRRYADDQLAPAGRGGHDVYDIAAAQRAHAQSLDLALGTSKSDSDTASPASGQASACRAERRRRAAYPGTPRAGQRQGRSRQGGAHGAQTARRTGRIGRRLLRGLPLGTRMTRPARLGSDSTDPTPPPSDSPSETAPASSSAPPTGSADTASNPTDSAPTGASATPNGARPRLEEPVAHRFLGQLVLGRCAHTEPGHHCGRADRAGHGEYSAVWTYTIDYRVS